MSDLISRSALIEAMDRFYNESYESRLMTPNHAECFMLLVNVVAKQPTVEAKPVVHGEWNRADGNHDALECSVCETWWRAFETVRGNGMNFCPNCGAKMVKNNE